MVLRLVGGESGGWVWVVGRSGIGCWSWNHDAAKCLPECLPSASLSQGSWKAAAAGSLIGRCFGQTVVGSLGGDLIIVGGGYLSVEVG